MTKDSIYYYKPGQFKEYIRTIADKSIKVSDSLNTLRESKNLSKEFKNMTVDELSKNPQEIQRLHKSLKSGMPPESKLKLPYKKSEREKEIIENIAADYKIDKSKAKSKVITGHYDDGNQTFNYSLEVAIAPRKDKDVSDAGDAEIRNVLKYLINCIHHGMIEEYFQRL
jgi:hypothetical protein